MRASTSMSGSSTCSPVSSARMRAAFHRCTSSRASGAIRTSRGSRRRSTGTASVHPQIRCGGNCRQIASRVPGLGPRQRRRTRADRPSSRRSPTLNSPLLSAPRPRSAMTASRPSRAGSRPRRGPRLGRAAPGVVPRGDAGRAPRLRHVRFRGGEHRPHARAGAGRVRR